MKAFPLFMRVLPIAAIVLVAAFSVAPNGTHAADQKMCYDLYQPVCAAKQVECFAAPCYPIYQTYTNTCFMQNENAVFVHDGECTASDTGPLKGTVSATTTVTSTTTVHTPPLHMGPGPAVLPGHAHIGGGVHPATSSAATLPTGTTTHASTSDSAVISHHTFFSAVASWWTSFLELFS